MNKTMRIVNILLITMMLVMAISNVVLALDADSVLKDFKPTSPDSTDNVLKLAKKILGFIQWVAIIGGTIIIAVLGVKYMMGSLEEKAEYKKSMIPFIVGTVVVMGAVTIANLVFKTFKL